MLLLSTTWIEGFTVEGVVEMVRKSWVSRG